MTREERKNRKFRMYNGKKIKRPNRLGVVLMSILLVIVLVFNGAVFALKDYLGVVDNIVFAKSPSGQD